jgi:hypothetical protein
MSITGVTEMSNESKKMYVYGREVIYLKDAQKLEAENIQLKDCLDWSKQVIEAAKPILEKIIAICQDRNDVTTCEVCCDKKCCEEYAIKEILFPRKEEKVIK